MSTNDETTVRRFYEEMCNGRHNDLATELFSADHRMHDPQVPADDGPAGIAEVVRTYQDGVEGHWQIEALYSAGDAVIVRWVGSGRHSGEINGMTPTGRDIRVDAITIHRM
jgi:predicted ester cyclase